MTKWILLGVAAGVVLLVIAAALVVVAAGLFYWRAPHTNLNGLGKSGGLGLGGDDNYTIERTEYREPSKPPEDLLVDDRLEDKSPKFDPDVIDRRPLGRNQDWLLNASAAVLRLDVPIIRPDVDSPLLTLYPSYAAASKNRHNLLPSVNMIDGKAKQFDDGLYAALDLSYLHGWQDILPAHRHLVKGLYERVGKDSPAAPYLAAGLEIAGIKVEATNGAEKARYLAAFNSDEIRSKPISFYTWSPQLGECFRFLRFFQRPFNESEQPVIDALVRALKEDSMLLADYRKAMAFYAKLTNPYRYRSLADLADGGPGQVRPDEPLPNTLPGTTRIAFFPASTSKETVLFEALFPRGLPPNADLMRELITKIRSGQVNLQPRPDSGWYDHQVYALETLLLPEKGEENPKLQLTRAYKKRMLEAFQALITKRRETHARQLDIAKAPMAAAPRFEENIQPRLRVEPNPSYYLRTARAYAFLSSFLEAATGPDVLTQMKGLKQGGARSKDLLGELHEMRDLFYGMYLVSAEDIGLKSKLAKEEVIDQDRCYRLATEWLSKAFQDEDLAADTRVAVPVFVDEPRRATRLWCTLGVRLAKLDVRYVRPPHVKPAKGEGEWKEVEGYRLGGVEYVIPVDEFAEVELKGLRVLSREEFRTICDREKTKEAILKALSQ
jgi:hypothetical protein